MFAAGAANAASPYHKKSEDTCNEHAEKGGQASARGPAGATRPRDCVGLPRQCGHPADCCRTIRAQAASSSSSGGPGQACEWGSAKPSR
eukprot:11337968-Alexandrium_andersonii.AAC.1